MWFNDPDTDAPNSPVIGPTYLTAPQLSKTFICTTSPNGKSRGQEYREKEGSTFHNCDEENFYLFWDVDLIHQCVDATTCDVCLLASTFDSLLLLFSRHSACWQIIISSKSNPKLSWIQLSSEAKMGDLAFWERIINGRGLVSNVSIKEQSWGIRKHPSNGPTASRGAGEIHWKVSKVWEQEFPHGLRFLVHCLPLPLWGHSPYNQCDTLIHAKKFNLKKPYTVTVLLLSSPCCCCCWRLN